MIIFVILLVEKVYAYENLQIKEFTGEDLSKEIIQEGWGNSVETVIVLNGKAVIDGILATPLSEIYNAPILLTHKENLKTETKHQLEKLKPKNIIVIGGENIVSNSVIKDIESILEKVNLERIGGKDRYETSLLIAKKIDSQSKIEKVYIGYGNSEPDLISIASKSGEEKAPLILTQKDNVSSEIYEWLEGENLLDAYFIGGEDVISNKVISSINNIVSKDVSGNRVWGKNRFETNGKVIEKFYSKKELDSVLVINENDYETALMSIPLGIKFKSPIIIVEKNNLNIVQQQILSPKYTNKIYKLGNNIQDVAFNAIVKELKYDLILDNQSGIKDVLFFIPHQDDEMLSFSTVIKQYMDNGYNVNIVLMTDGSNVGVNNVINGTNGICKIHNKKHNPKLEGAKINGLNINTFSIQNLVQCRNEEYFRALYKLGLDKSNIHISKFVQKDNNLNKDIAIKGIMEYLNKYPNSIVHTFYHVPFSKGNHADHLGLGRASKELYDNKKINKLYLHVEPYLVNDFRDKNKNEKLYEYYPSTKAQNDSIVAGLREYSIWQPQNGKYAIGYHSVKRSIDIQIKKPVNYLVEYK